MIDRNRLQKLFMELVEVDSESGKEAKMAQRLKEELTALGAKPYEDNAGEQLGTEAGNVIARFEGDKEQPPIILSAHMDTVKPGIGKKAVVDGDVIKSEGDTVLGADDAAGIAAILEAIQTVHERGESHPPIEVVFTAYEEGGLNGSRHLDYQTLSAKEAYIFDSGGSVGSLVVEAPGQDKYKFKIIGKSAHAGISPEEGVNAIKVAGEIISELELGRVDDQTTLNIGVIKGGEATNVICPLVEMDGEARSRDENRLAKLTEHVQEVAQRVCDDYGAELDFDARRLYSAYNFSKDDDVVQRAVTAIEKTNLEPRFEATGGGSDANIFNANGIRTINLGMGYQKVHTTEEFIPIKDLENSAMLAYHLIVV